MEGKRRRKQQRMRWLDSVSEAMSMNFDRLWTLVEDRVIWGAAVQGLTKTSTWQQQWDSTGCHRARIIQLRSTIKKQLSYILDNHACQ